MKKLLLILAAYSWVGYASAQYYHYRYTSAAGGNTVTDGFNTIAPGQFQVETTNNPSVFSTFQTNLAGAPIAAFCNDYTVLNTFGQPITLIGKAKSCEFAGGGGFGVAGGYIDPNTGVPPLQAQGVYYANLATGANTLYSLPPLPTGGFTNYRVTSMFRSALFPGQVCILGNVFHAPLGDLTFIMRIPQAGAGIMVSMTYSLPGPTTTTTFNGFDFVENPGINQILVAGRTDALIGLGSPMDGFVMRVDANTLLPINPVFLYGLQNSNDYLTSIALSANPLSGGGYIVGGTTNANGNDDYWQMLLNAGLNVVWASAFDYSVTPLSNNRAEQIIERLNVATPTPAYEYYQVGTTDNGFFGGRDIMVLKSNANGMGVGIGEFTYGSPIVEDNIGLAIDQYNVGAPGVPAGLTIFGSTINAGAATFLDLYRAYFNGIITCDGFRRDPRLVTAPKFLVNKGASTQTKFTLVSGSLSRIPNFFNGGCFANTVAGGNNTKVLADKTDNGLGVKLSSNVLTMNGNEETKLTIDNAQNTTATLTIRLHDIVGKEYYAQTIKAEQGQSEIALSLSSLNISNSGIYVLNVTGADGSVISTMKIFISK